MRNEYRALLRYADARRHHTPRRSDVGWKLGGPNASLTVFGRNGTPSIMRPISKRFVRFLRGAGPRRDAAIEEQQRNESRVIAIMANAIRNPRLYNGAADSLAMAL